MLKSRIRRAIWTQVIFGSWSHFLCSIWYHDGASHIYYHPVSSLVIFDVGALSKNPKRLSEFQTLTRHSGRYRLGRTHMVFSMPISEYAFSDANHNTDHRYSIHTPSFSVAFLTLSFISTGFFHCRNLQDPRPPHHLVRQRCISRLAKSISLHILHSRHDIACHVSNRQRHGLHRFPADASRRH